MPTSTTSTIVSFLRDHHDYSVEFCGAFLGAFFAFLFFIIGEKIKRKIYSKKEIKKAHAYLERYLGDLRQLVDYNNGLVTTISNDYQRNMASLRPFVNLPTKDGLTMKIKDLIFINHLEFYDTEIKRLNLTIDSANSLMSHINLDLTSMDQKKYTRGKIILDNFLEELNSLKKLLDYHLSRINELTAENRILLKKLKNWQKINLKYHTKRNSLIEKEIQNNQSDNPLIEEHIEKLKKFGLIDDQNV